MNSNPMPSYTWDDLAHKLGISVKKAKPRRAPTQRVGGSVAATNLDELMQRQCGDGELGNAPWPHSVAVLEALIFDVRIRCRA